GQAPQFTQGVTEAARPVVDLVEPVAQGVGGSATTLAYGVAGDVTPFAYGVVGDVDPFAHSVVGQVAPFAGDLTDTVRSTGGPLAGHAVTGVQGVTESITPGYVQNAHLGST